MIENLSNVGAVQILERNLGGAGKHRGQLRVFVRNPRIVSQSQPPGIEADPQRALIPDAIPPRITSAHPAVSGPKPPVVSSPKSPDTVALEPPQAETTSHVAYPSYQRDPAVLSPKPPDAFIEFKDRMNSLSSTPQGRGVNEFNEGPAPLSAIMPPALDAAGARFMARTDRKAQRERLKSDIIRAAGIKDPDWWVAGQAADMVYDRGLDIEELRDKLSLLNRRRLLPKGDPNRIPNPGGWLQTAMEKLANEKGWSWGSKQRRDRQSEAQCADGCDGGDERGDLHVPEDENPLV